MKHCGTTTWSVCSHIYKGDYLEETYSKIDGRVTFVIGLVMCDDCHNRWADGEVEGVFMESEQMCDGCLLDKVLKPMVSINQKYASKHAFNRSSILPV